jgi:rubrerythrin
VGRKRFLKYAARSGAAVLIGLESCRKTTPVGGKHTIDVGSGDTGILNFAYALEQLEAAFYIKVNASFYKNITDAEKQVLTEIMYHEVAHRDFFKKALSSAAIQDLKTDFSDVDFTSRASVLAPTTGLDFSRTLEYLESTFYTMGLAANGLVPASDRTIIAQISKHETDHVSLLQTTITSLGGTPVAKPNFDFTAGGKFADVFSNYQTFLALSNAFEDTGVRAYKGAAPSLLGSGAVLTAALDIHSVEARHASEIRRMRGLKGWVSNADANGLPAAIYAGEDNKTQLGIDVTTITSVPAVSVTEAFDEPLTMSAVLAIATPFIMQ